MNWGDGLYTRQCHCDMQIAIAIFAGIYTYYMSPRLEPHGILLARVKEN